jgi:hypothetical protein
MKNNRRRYPTQKRLWDLFVYCPSGQLVRKSNNKRAGSHKGNIYRRVGVDYASYYEHRLIFLYHKGYLPPFIDHKNRDVKDNRIENLRKSTSSLNSWNKKDSSSNSGSRGVFLKQDRKRAKPYEAYIHKEGKKYYLGHFYTLLDAIRARRQAELKYYGEFCR